jgi:prephenate dehydrogenase
MAEPTADPNRRTIAIVGLGATGIAVGRALARVRSNFQLVGHDPDPDRVKAALAAGAVDNGSWNLANTVTDADLVILAEPTSRVVATLGFIAPHVPAGALVTDTASRKAPVLAAAREKLPPGVSFVGGHLVPPAAPPEAQPLAGATWCLMPLPTASEEAVRVLVNLVGAVGAVPLFIDADEHDALLAGAQDVPALMLSALLAQLAASPSMRDLSRLVSPALVAASAAEGSPAERRDDLLANAQAVTIWLDQVHAVLAAYRRALGTRDGAALEALLLEADRARLSLSAPPNDDARAEAHEELKNRQPMRDFLFGRRREPPKPSA